MKHIKSLLALLLLVSFVSAPAATIRLTWADNASNESGQRIERATGTFGGTFENLREIAADLEQVDLRLLPPATTYRFRVRAFNAKGDSAPSNTVTISTPAGPPPLSDLADRTVDLGTSTGPIPFTIVDDSTNNFAGLSVTATSSDPLLVPAAGITLSGTLGSRTITLQPAAGRTGTATITVTVTDGQATVADTFLLTVTDPTPAAPSALQGSVLL